MKSFRKLTAIATSAILSLGLCLAALSGGIAAFADGSTDYAITIANPQEGCTYYAYKIFDVTYTGMPATPSSSSSDTTYAYSISGGSNWLSIVDSYASETNNGLTLTLAKATQGDSSGVWAVTFTDSFSAADFASYLSQQLSSSITADGTASGGVISLQSPGYYLVTCSNGTTHALCELTTTDSKVTIYDKNVPPTVDKKQGTASGGNYSDGNLSAEFGSTVYFKITTTIPDTTGYDNYTFKVSDTLSEGLSLQKPIYVNIVDSSSSSSTDISGKVTTNISDNSFTVTFKLPDNDIPVGSTVEITYSATVTGYYDTYTNEAKVVYSNDPTTGGTGTDIATTYTYNGAIAVYKVATPADAPLAGATFVLKKTEGGSDSYYNISGGAVSWGDYKDATVLRSDNNGVLLATPGYAFYGLKDGTYYLVEVSAPTGYNSLVGDFEITVSGSDYRIATATVYNASGSLLPSTGGMGTRVLYTVGALLISLAGVLLIVSRKKGEAEA